MNFLPWDTGSWWWNCWTSGLNLVISLWALDLEHERLFGDEEEGEDADQEQGGEQQEGHPLLIQTDDLQEEHEHPENTNQFDVDCVHEAVVLEGDGVLSLLLCLLFHGRVYVHIADVQIAAVLRIESEIK